MGYSTVAPGDVLSSVTAESLIRVDMLRRDARDLTEQAVKGVLT